MNRATRLRPSEGGRLRGPVGPADGLQRYVLGDMWGLAHERREESSAAEKAVRAQAALVSMGTPRREPKTPEPKTPDASAWRVVAGCLGGPAVESAEAMIMGTWGSRRR